MAVGQKLGQIIKDKGLKQIDVANKAGVSPQALNNLIKRDSARADIQILLKICKALDINVDIFADDALAEYNEMHRKARQTPTLTERQQRIVDLFGNLTEPQQDNIIGRAELMAEQNEEIYSQEENA